MRHLDARTAISGGGWVPARPGVVGTRLCCLGRGEPGVTVDVEHEGTLRRVVVSDRGWWLVLVPREA